MARTPLQPKQTTAIRLALKRQGYSVIPLRNKTLPFKRWPTQPNSEADIKEWGGLCTGIRMEGDLVVFDLDTRSAELRNAALKVLWDICPEFMVRAPRRNSGGTTVALFGRAVTTIKHLRSARWRHDAESCHFVEVFSGHAIRQFAVHGPHSPGRVYAFEERALWEVPRKELPIFPGDRIGEFIQRCDDLMMEMGLEKVVPTGVGVGDAVKVYDLLPDQVMRLQDGTEITLLELEEDVRSRTRRVVGFANIWDPGSKTADRVLVNYSSTGLALWDTKMEISHRWADRAPLPPLDLSGLKQLAAATTEDAPPRPGFDAAFEEQCRWLQMCFGYCRPLDKAVEIYRASDDCLSTTQALEKEYRSWASVHTGKRGGQHITTAVAVWQARPDLIRIRGVRMRPDREFPIYVEDGETFKNTYRRRVHKGSGTIWPWLRFMAHLLPSRRERIWFCDWLAHKYRNPGVPGVAVIMVACDGSGPVYGAGRGVLRDVLARLFGTEYVRQIDFDILTGTSSQAVFNDWAAHALLVTVDEAKDTSEAGRWSERRAVYERLKEVVDPRVIERTFRVKGMAGFRGRSFASYLIFSNNMDALQVPIDDRRFSALANGTRMSTRMARELTAWMEDEGNIAELGRWLAARNLVEFDPYQILATETKTVMAELALTELDEWFMEARKLLTRSDLFTSEQLYGVVARDAGAAARSEEFTRRVRRRIRAEVKRVGDFRMPRDRNRAYILTWRDYNGPPVTDAVIAQERVNYSADLISGKITRLRREL